MSREITGQLTQNQIKCQRCGKEAVIGYNKPHSLHRTKRIVKPNIQKIQGQILCTRCLRTQTKKSV